MVAALAASCIFLTHSCGVYKNKTALNSRDSLTYCFIPAGNFLMGCVPGDTTCEAEDKPQHNVTIANPFWISNTEVTVGAFRKFIKATGYTPYSIQMNKGRIYIVGLKDWAWVNGINWEHPFDTTNKAADNMPVVQVSWDDALAYCKWAGGRLPEEEEWEYTARGELVNKKYPWDNNWTPHKTNKALVNTADKTTLAVYSSMQGIDDYNDGFALTAPVASFPANGYSLYDMAGNVWEFTNTRFLHGYDQTITDSSFIKYDTRIVRGGAWCYHPYQLGCSYRGYFGRADFWSASLGFRCVIDSL
ncbi:MAG: formylglycine-generating enzyme family protein [Agriterribacter sp.]